MQKWKYYLVWLSRITHCRGFGIQSPTDYWLVRYVINEHWPYYKYRILRRQDDWLTQKLGLLYFRLANWRQPSIIQADRYRNYLQAGCSKAAFGKSKELVLLTLNEGWRKQVDELCSQTDERTVLVVEGIRNNKKAWSDIMNDKRTGVCFDLYFCGIVLFDKRQTKQHYIINF